MRRSSQGDLESRGGRQMADRRKDVPCQQLGRWLGQDGKHPQTGLCSGSVRWDRGGPPVKEPAASKRLPSGC